MYILKQDIENLMSYIHQYDRIIIHRHLNPDPDAIGSQLGLKELIQYNFPHKEVYAVGNTAETLQWMGEMDRIHQNDYSGSLVIITDTANRPRIDDDRYIHGDCLIKIDHHPLVDEYGDLSLVYPQASSTCELITQMIQQNPSMFRMNHAAASLLYAGIVGDTGRFMFDNTTESTFESASFLMQYEVDLFKIHTTFNTLSFPMLKLQSYLLDQLNVSEPGIAWMKITQEVLQKFDITEEETNAFVNLPSVLAEVYAWVMLVEQKDGTWRMRIRSKGPVINQLAAKYDGGGHPKASGANAANEDVINQFIEDLKEQVQYYLNTFERSE